MAKQTCFHVENDSVVDSSNCEDGNPLPNPEIKLCCEEICKGMPHLRIFCYEK